jgi:peptidoglycan/xylan/chitin deacetylase (PgdA/CDA1 family)
MRWLASALAAAVLVIVLADTGATQTCSDPAGALGVSRIIEIDPSAGPIFGDMTKRAKEPAFLEPKEVVLTFDDGPVPWITTPILDTLDKFCTKATFFSVGEMALAYPRAVKDVLARGHTLGTHTWSHPLNLRSLSLAKAKDQIERGFAAVTLAAGQPIAPFFRFPGLSDSDALLAHMQKLGVASFTVDVVSNDSYIGSVERLTQRVLKETEARQGGILLFHDIKPATAKALPGILTELKARGYRIVHLRPKASMSPLAGYDSELQPILAKAETRAKEGALLPFFGAVGPPKSLTGDDLPVTALAPAARERFPAAVATTSDAEEEPQAAKPHARKHRGASHRSRRQRRTADADSDS